MSKCPNRKNSFMNGGHKWKFSHNETNGKKISGVFICDLCGATKKGAPRK